MHILITVNASWNIVNFRRGLVAALISDGHRITTLTPPDPVADAVLTSLGCRVLPLSMDVKGMSPFHDLALMARFWAVFGRERPDAILGYTVKNNIFGALAARARGIPFLPNVTGLGTAFLSGSQVQWLVETLYRQAFATVPMAFFQNGDDQTLFETRGLIRREQARLLPGSGIDLDRFTPAPLPNNPPDAPHFLMIARLLRDKGILEFASAARLLRKQFPAARFSIVGPLGAENRTAIDVQTVQVWQDEGILTHLGETQDVRPFISDADCVVLPSYREGMPRTLLEAAAMARPVIATNVPGCRDALAEGETGFLCKVRDGDDLARACLRFIALPPDDRAAMGQAGRARVARLFGQEHVIAAYRAALADLEASA